MLLLRVLLEELGAISKFASGCAKQLREELTPAEIKLWATIRNDQLGVSFRRQHAFGNYVTDFCCIKKKLIIEMDGGHHLEQQDYDIERTKFLESHGYTLVPQGDDVRFWNNEVLKDLNGVLKTIIFNHNLEIEKET